MIDVKETIYALFLLGLVRCCLASSPSPATLPACVASAPGFTLQPASSCIFDVASVEHTRQLQLLGASGPRLPTVLLKAPTGFQGLQGVETAVFRDVIFESTDSFPNHSIDLATLLRPPHVAGSATAVNLTNVVLLHTISASQAAVAVATLRGVVSDPIVQRAIADWTLQLYTDYVSFVYVGSFTGPGLTCNGCGVFLQFVGSSGSNSAGGSSSSSSWQLPTTTPDEPRPAMNYLLNVDNSTFIPSLMRYASIDSPRAFLVLLSSNITWGRHPALVKAPGGFMELNRPVMLVGQHGHLTSIDLGMVANAVHLTGAYSNLTCHGVVLENQGYGDRQSGSQVAGLSIMNVFNMWLLYWPRSDLRISLVNTTTVASHQEAVQYMIYWQIMTSSSDPVMRAEAAWMQRGPGITLWESIVYPKKLLDVRFVCRNSLAKDTWRVSTPIVFPQLPDNVDDPSLYQQGLQAHRAAPLATLAGNEEQLQRWLITLSGLPREGLSMIITPQVSLGPSDTNSWPPPGDIILKAPRTVMLGQRVCELHDARRAETTNAEGITINGHRAVADQMPQRALLEGLGLSSEAAAAAVRCSTDNSSDTEGNSPLVQLAHFPIIDWVQDTSLLQLQPAGNSGALEMNTLTLVGLSQGNGVGAKASEGSVGRRLLAIASSSSSSSSSSGGGGGSSLGHRLMGWPAPPKQSWEEYHRQQALEDQQWMGPWQQLQPSPSIGSNGSSSSSSSSNSGKASGSNSSKASRANANRTSSSSIASRGRHLAAAAASSAGLSQADVRVWTHVVWAVKRAANGQLVLRNVAMGLPKPEFKRLLAASRAAPGGAFNIPLEGGGALSAKSSTYHENCCLVISSYTAPGMNATQLLLFTDPDVTRSTPPGYIWPFDGSEGLGPGEGIGRAGPGLSSAGLAGLIVGLCLAVVLAAILVWVFVSRRRMTAGQQYVQDANGIYKLPSGDIHRSSSNGTFGSSSHGYSKDLRMGRAVGPDGRPVADVAAVGSALMQDQQGYQQGFNQGYSQGLQCQSASHSGGSGSGTGIGQGADMSSSGAGLGSDSTGGLLGNKRWHKLTTAISSKVQDIHQQRLRTAFMQSQRTGVVTLGGPPQSTASRSPGAAAPTAGDSSTSLQASGGVHNSCSSSGTPMHAGSSAAGAGGLLNGSEQQDDSTYDSRNTLELKELIGRGTFGTVYRATWQGVNVAVKLLQLPPGTGRTMTESGMFSGSGGTAGLLRAVGGWSNAAAGSGSQRDSNLMKHEHMAVQEAAIGSCMMHPNIVSVYSISLRPSGLPAPLAAKPALAAGAGSSGGLLLLREDGTAVMGASELTAAGGPKPSAASLELLPWEMQLVMEYCDQGTLREALDAGMLVSKASGQHDVPIVLSLAHNVACAMAYLHQEHIIHGDLKASNVLLKTCVPVFTSSSSACAAQPASSQTGKSSAAYGPSTTGSWALNQQGQGVASSSRSSDGRAAAAVGSTGSAGRPPAGLTMPSSSAAAGEAAMPIQQGEQQPAAAADDDDGQGSALPVHAAAESQGPAASSAIIDAAAAAADETTSGMHSLLKCGWVVAKVSDFGLSLCVKPEETHVSSVHAGTLTHMAPEMLMHGRCSKASDVYAFGILLWEVATGGKAFAGIPKPLLGHCVISQGMRPTWPQTMRSSSNGGSSVGSSNGDGMAGNSVGNNGAGPWAGLVSLTERCWAQEPQARPSFSEVVQQLARLLKAATSSQASSMVAVGPPLAAFAAANGSSSALPLLVTPGLHTPAAVRPGNAADSSFGAHTFSSTGQNPAVGSSNPAYSGPGARNWFFTGLFGDKQDAGSSVVSAGGPVSGAIHGFVPVVYAARQDPMLQQQQQQDGQASLHDVQQQQQQQEGQQAQQH